MLNTFLYGDADYNESLNDDVVSLADSVTPSETIKFLITLVLTDQVLPVGVSGLTSSASTLHDTIRLNDWLMIVEDRSNQDWTPEN